MNNSQLVLKVISQIDKANPTMGGRMSINPTVAQPLGGAMDLAELGLAVRELSENGFVRIIGGNNPYGTIEITELGRAEALNL